MADGIRSQGWEMTLWAGQTRAEHTDCARAAFLYILVWQFTPITDVCTDPHKRNMEALVGESKSIIGGVAALGSNRCFLRGWTVSGKFSEFILRFPYPIPAPNTPSCRVGEPRIYSVWSWQAVLVHRNTC